MTAARVERAAAVRARVDDAAVELRALRCADHAAAPALRVIKLAEHTLTGWWLPLLDATLDREEPPDAA